MSSIHRGARHNISRGFLYICVAFSAISILVVPTGGCASAKVITVKDSTTRNVSLNDAPAPVTPSAWTWLNPRQTCSSIFDISFARDGTGWAVGANRTILKTIDGQNWQLQFLGGWLDYLYNVAAIDRETAWVFGMGGETFVTRDGGATWEPMKTPWSMDRGYGVRTIKVFNGQNIWVLGGIGKNKVPAVFKTGDGGRTWDCERIPKTASTSHICFVNRNEWLSTTSDSLLTTEDGGSSWREHNIKLPLVTPSNDFDAVAALNTRRVWVAGGNDREEEHNKTPPGLLLFTSDGGSSWRSRTFPGLGYISHIYALSEKDVWLVGKYGVCKTTNGGLSWTKCYKLPPNSGDWITDLEVRDQQNAYLSVCQQDSPIGGEGICRTVDGGKTWIQQFNSVTRSHLTSISRAGDSTLWAVGDKGTIIKTTDGGATWYLQPSGVTTNLTCVAAVDTKTAYVVGDGEYSNNKDSKSNPLGTISILKTSDGGATWTPQLSGNDLQSVTAVDANTAWAVSFYGASILHTTDGGQNWVKQSLPPDAGTSLTAISAVNRSVVWAVGYQHAYRTVDGGATWVTVHKWDPDDRNEYSLISISAVDRNTAWTTSSSGLLRTQDAGVSWTNFTPPTKYGSDWVQAIGRNHILAADGSGVSETRDAGATWTSIDSGMNRSDTGVSGAATAHSIWLVGNGGMVITTQLD